MKALLCQQVSDMKQNDEPCSHYGMMTIEHDVTDLKLIAADVLTFPLVSAPTVIGASQPGMVATELVMPNRVPA